jgi:hypothetical protein
MTICTQNLYLPGTLLDEIRKSTKGIDLVYYDRDTHLQTRPVFS